jgi:hypothetical protein
MKYKIKSNCNVGGASLNNNGVVRNAKVTI